LDHERALQIVVGYTRERPLSEKELTALPTATEHAALIIAFHRYYRHNVWFPDLRKSQLPVELIDFLESLAGFDGASHQ
jgi:homoserine kinase type II